VAAAQPQAADKGPAQNVEYYCPMHPNIVKAEPGKCPVCGMALVKRSKPAPKPPATSQPTSQPTTAEGKAKIVNARCPIMGGAIDPARVSDSLTRDYKGQKVAFCCGGCPASWDKLTPEQKDAKLKAATDSR
jgi:Cu(I)/Ag(I) efflux system membrane fusion protein